MRVMFSVWPNPSHLYPIVPLAWALSAAGHEVCVASHPDIAEATAAVGLTAVPLGDPAAMPVPMGPGRAYTEERAAVAHITDALGLDPADREPWDTFSEFMLPAMWDFHPYDASPDDPRTTMDAMVAFARNWEPDLVIWDPCLPGAAVAARACGAAHARWWTGPDYFAWAMDKHASLGAGRAIDNPLERTVGPVAARYGLDVDDDLLLGQWTITHLPEGMRLPVSTRTVTVRWVPYSAQTVMPEWLHSKPERPRVGISLGLSWRKYLSGGWEHIPALLDAVSELDIEVVATLDETQLGDVTSIPDNVRVLDYLPLNQLAPTCSALIHHGGFASFAVAAAYNVPQLITDHPGAGVTAMAGDDGMGATRHAAAAVTVDYVAERGAGLILDISKPSPDVMRKQIMSVLTEPSFQEATANLHKDFLATPSPAEIVPVLERLTEQHRARH